MRPRTLEEFIGQEHILGSGRLLRRAIAADQLSSLIFYGPPGTGKTTLAQVIAGQTRSHFMSINAVLAGVADIRESIKEAQRRLGIASEKSILFVDEVHRFNKSQQDALLPYVEDGTIILIGATTENPYFEVNKALVSRSRIFQLKHLDETSLLKILDFALEDETRGYGKLDIEMTPEAKDHLIKKSQGDARSMFNAIELAVETELEEQGESIRLDLEIIEESIQERAVLYDKDGDAHYDTISAFIKSVRGSDPDASLYWLAKMISAGEDPRFLFRRMIILASEDVGLAAPEVLGQVMAAAQAYDYVGLPEGRFHLTQACLALCNAPKSNSTMGIFDALKSVQNENDDDVPQHLMDKSRDAEDFGHGKGYLYPHAYDDHWVAQQYLPDGLKGKVFYQPSNSGAEKEVKVTLEMRREANLAIMLEDHWNRFEEHDTQSDASVKESWMQRSFGNSGQTAEWARSVIIESADLKNEDLVLDLNAGSGLLTWEAIRRAKSGGVWSVVFDEVEEQNMNALAHQSSFWYRPVVVSSKRENLKADLMENDEKIKFDKVLSRHLFDKGGELSSVLSNVSELLADGGVIYLWETLYREEQRLSSMIDGVKDNALVKNFKEVEEEFYQHSGNSKFQFSIDGLRLGVPEGLKIVEHREHQVEMHKVFNRKTVDAWFSEASDLGRFVRTELNDNLAEAIRDIFVSQLAGKPVKWKRKFLHCKLFKN